MTDTQTDTKQATLDEARAIAIVRKWLNGGCSSWGLPLQEIAILITALAAKNEELAAALHMLDLSKATTEAVLERAERAEDQLAEANKALDAVFDDTQARTKAGMVYGINGHPTLSPATLNIVAQARFAARCALEDHRKEET